jgi:hypothetical protein
MTNFLYRLARAAAWGRAIGRAAGGNPRALGRRIRNRPIYALLGRLLRRL